MDRRGFLKLIGLAAAGVALEHAISNGRVWSFPSDIKIYRHIPYGFAFELQLEKVRTGLPILYERDPILDGLIREGAIHTVGTRGFRLPLMLGGDPARASQPAPADASAPAVVLA